MGNYNFQNANDGKTVSVVVPSYNRSHLLSMTLPTYLQEGVCELILIDDCSTDNTTQIVRELQKRYPQIIYLRNEVNMKQTASKNRGIDIAKGDYIYFGDDDSFLQPGTIQTLKQTLEKYRCGAVMARPLCAGPNYSFKHHDAYVRWIINRNKAADIREIYDVSTLTFNWKKWMNYPIEVPCLHACMLVRTELAKVCRFDTNYIGCAYREETDFSFRLSLDYGAKLMYDSKGVQINLPVYMVRKTGARSGGYEVWRESAIQCNAYFLDKLWSKIQAKYGITTSKEVMQKQFIEKLPISERNDSRLKKWLKDLYFTMMVYK